MLPDGSIVSAVADGAGSAENGERGAEIAVGVMIGHLKQCIADQRTNYDQMLREGAQMARETIITHALREGTVLRSYASTLLAVVLTPGGGGALQIGDGVIVVNDSNGEWCWVFWPQRGEYANTTYFLTDDNALDQLETELFSADVMDIALMSDGLEPLALHYVSNAVHEPFFSGMFQPLHQSKGVAELAPLSAALEQFLQSERVGSRTDDDVSLILATRRENAAPR